MVLKRTNTVSWFSLTPSLGARLGPDKPLPKSVNNVYSDLLPIISDVPQGSILGSLAIVFSFISVTCVWPFHLVTEQWDELQFKKNYSFKHKLNTPYSISDSTIPHVDSHKDLGVILSGDLDHGSR